METKGKRSFLYAMPSWLQAILWVFASTIVLFGLGEGVSKLIKINENIGGSLAYIIFDIMIAVGCFFIIKWNPKSIWYVVLICNAVGIIAAIIEPTFWHTSLWMLICGGWVLSLIASFIGARIGRRTATSDPNAPQ
jgi:hypothetical protein